MIRYIAGRLFQALLVVLAVATITFVLLHLAPGSPLSGDSDRFITQEQHQQLERNFGLDQPIHVQYFRYLGQLLRGDFGISFSRHVPVWEAIRAAAPNTVLLAFAAWLIDLLIGVTLGAAQAIKSNSYFDRIASGFTLALYSTPVFLLGFVAMLLFGLKLGWFQVGGVHDPVALPYLSPMGRLVDLMWHLALPALTLGLVGAAGTARYQRAALLEVMHLDFIRTARAKGLPAPAVWIRHGLRNALLPTITVMALSLPMLLSGAVLVESVFIWPGLGALTTGAISARDYPLVTGTAILAAMVVVTASLLADLVYQVADPRTRAQS